MNEQIEKLAEQCYKTGPIGKDGWPEYSKFNYKKFSELIVRECADIADSIGEHGYIASEEMLKHFGVEE